ncbi:hypothetical protein GCM10007304_00600 [Rhodococcoides trifolii]|uniref:ESX secretion-associated protein EspG n=1 Tax=Rhodococcoides trifolii TaxID=908250 RepID=A0A917FKH8_9NOCA|nr:ESX secretion-associated protein EspG [Rhodococcus trifolii]GGF90580.1 hypothetical protein GCM10007304_00600 [Rhodococcus trifolii]
MALEGGLITMGAAVDLHLDDDEMALVMHDLGIDELPGVLDWRPPHRDDDERRPAFARVLPELRTRGVIDGSGHVEAVLAQHLRTLYRSTWDVEVRTVTRTRTGPIIERRCLSSGVDGLVVADRTSTGYRIRTAGVGMVVDRAAPLRFSGISAPTDTMAAALDRPQPATWVALGCDDATAVILGEVLSASDTHVEIVMVGHRGPIPERIGTPIALFETPRGRILATTSYAADGTAWTALAPGTDARIRSEIQTLIDLF